MLTASKVRMELIVHPLGFYYVMTHGPLNVKLGGTCWWHWSCMILDSTLTYHFVFLKPWAAAHMLL
jgi:hypothetical protein